MMSGDDVDEDGASKEIDVFAWRSVQRVVFTLTNPVDTHQITVVNVTASLLDEQGNYVERLPAVRFGEIVLSGRKTHSLAYEFKV